jgi:hypothetical protein
MRSMFDTVTIHYWNTDDGIWLRCTLCDWTVPLGFQPTVGLAVRHTEQHTVDFHAHPL